MRLTICLWVLFVVSGSVIAFRDPRWTSVLVTRPGQCGGGAAGLHSARQYGRGHIDLWFKKPEGNGGGDETDGGGFFNNLKSYIPGLRRFSRQNAKETAPSAGYRYELRLTKNNNTGDKRHIITRIMRFLPDIQWETACDIYDTAFQNGRAIVRVLNSEREALELQSVLLRADPPVVTVVFDTKRGKVVV